MTRDTARRALEIFREDGIAELFKSSLDRIVPSEIYYKAQTEKNVFINDVRYECPADPYNTIHVDSNRITHLVKERSITEGVSSGYPVSKPRFGGLGQIRGGDWRKTMQVADFNEHWVKQGFLQRFVHGMDWCDTAIYEMGTVTPDELSKYDRIYDSIKKEGYKEGHRGAKPGERYVKLKNKLEPQVIIDNNGEFILWDGKHRVAICQILNYNIPVHVLCRHKQWQEARDDIYKNGFTEEYDDELRNHPDLQDILD